MYKHVAMFWLHDKQQTTLEQACQIPQSIPQHISGVLSVEVGPAAVPGENACDLCASILFADKQAHTACFQNPVFLKLRSDMLSLCQHITTADYPLDSPVRRMPALLSYLGPANSDADTLGRMLDAGMDGVCLSLMHHQLEDHLPVLESLHHEAATRNLRPQVFFDDVPEEALSTCIDKTGADGIIAAIPSASKKPSALRSALGKKRRLLAKHTPSTAPEALLPALQNADILLIAHGAMPHHEMPPQLPALQIKVAGLATQAGIPFYMADSLLSSMRQSIMPASNELAAIHFAVSLGASGLVLTKASAQGRYPAEAMSMLKRTAAAALMP